MSKKTSSIFIEITIVGIIIAVVFAYISNKNIYHGYISDPVQTYISNPSKINIEGSDDNVEASILAEYSIEGVVKSKKLYLWDYSSQVSKYDVALAWGDLNNEEIDKHISYSQGGRWYNFCYSPDAPVGSSYISKHSANVHLIHKDINILAKLIGISKNSHIKLKGYLVKVHFKDAEWKSSLTRNDTGNGACEIMYVTDVEIIE